MIMVIRTLYNNMGFKAPCSRPKDDPLCAPCFKEDPIEGGPLFGIDPPKPTDEQCQGSCWEQKLCTVYRWGCTPTGRSFGKRTYPGMEVYLTYRQPDGNYTLWGKTMIETIDDGVLEQGEGFGKGYVYAHLRPFQPLPKEQWVRNLTDRELVGEKWLMGRYRYCYDSQETGLGRLLGGANVDRQTESPLVAPYPQTTILSVAVTAHIDEKLKKMAHDEGRHKEEIVREAIAEWLKERGL